MRWNVLSQFTSKDSLVNQLLENRGLKPQQEKEQFLNPRPTSEFNRDFSDEFRESLGSAAKLIKESIKNDKLIVIHGDYDADGISASAILYRTIKNELGHKNVAVFIPNRFEHGYGVTQDSINSIKEQAGSVEGALLVTVDTGITANAAVDYAKGLGLKVVITDHHQRPNPLPAADVIVWNDEMVGSGVAWALANVLGAKDERLLGLVALATVTDLQPLFGFNRSVVKEGLKVLNSNPFIGIKALHQVAGRKGAIETYDLGWVLGPRLNATGRIGSADEAFTLLTEDDPLSANKHALELNRLNAERQDRTLEMYGLANTLNEGEKPRVIVSVSPDYHEGIIGLVAAKLVQQHHRPAIVISLDGNYGKGSVRSVSGVDIISFLRKFEDLFDNVGGHPMAAGFTIQAARIQELIENVNKLAAEDILDEHLEPSMTVDMEVPLEVIDMGFVEELEKLKPFGMGNREPTFVSRSVGVVGRDAVGKNKEHLTLQLLGGGKIYKGIWFGGMEKAPALEIGQKIDLVYSPEKKEYNGRTYLDLVIKDISTNY